MTVRRESLSPRRLRDLRVGMAQIDNLIVGDPQISGVGAAKLLAESILGNKIYVGGTSFELDGGNVYLLIKDTQGTPVTRIKLGKTGAGATDYGLKIWGADGSLQWDLTGARTEGIQNNAVSVNGFFTDDAIVDPLGLSEIEIGSITISTNGGHVSIIGSALCFDLSGASTYFVYIRKDSTTGTLIGTSQIYNPGNTSITAVAIAIDATPAPTQTYKLMGQIFANYSTGEGFKQRRLSATNFKK